jgi:hypothetical protein
MYTSGPKPQRRSLNELAMLFQRNLNREVNAENGRVEGSRSLCWSKARYHWLRSMVMRDKLFAVVFKISGRSAAWLARLVRDQEVGGSNPLAPTTSFRSSDLLHTKMRRAPGLKPSTLVSCPLDASALCSLNSLPCNGSFARLGIGFSGNVEWVRFAHREQ